MTEALLLVAHGSRTPDAHGAMERVFAALAHRADIRLTATGYLEISSPSIPAAIDQLVVQGATVLYILPYFLHAGRHMTRDLLQLIEDARNRYPTVRILLADAMGFHPALVDLLADRLRNLRDPVSPVP